MFTSSLCLHNVLFVCIVTICVCNITGVRPGDHHPSPHREHPAMQVGRHPRDRPPDQEWPRRPAEHQWSSGRECEWPPPEHHRFSPPREWSQRGNWYGEDTERSYSREVDRSHDDGNKRREAPPSSDTDSVHEAVQHLAEQMKSVKGLASKLNLPKSPKTAKEWQEVAKMVAAAAAGSSNQQEQPREQAEDDTQKCVAAMLANDSDSDTEKATEERRLSPAREFDGTYVIPPEFRKLEEEQPHYSMDYGHGEPHLGHRSPPHDYLPSDSYHHDHPPPVWNEGEFKHFPPAPHGPYHQPLSPPSHRHRFPPDYGELPPPHSRYPLPPSDWYDGRPRTPPYPQYGPPLPHDIPTSMLDEMTSDQQLLLAAAVNSGSGKYL